jgi:Asp-tRNA(Asn)/Glu-tRNA(Gln) amidotransferase A subunit family amidase
MTQNAPFRLLEATIGSIQHALQAGDLTCRELVQGYLNRIAAYDHQGPALTSIQNLNPSALAEAARIDAEIRANGINGPLHGIPVVVKDQVETTEMPTTFGSAVFKDFVSHRDATIITRMRQAGALILAKTTMGEFAAAYAGSAFGVCRNAYDSTRDASGSSSGTGAALAANFAVVGIGEDTLGSIRGPAARASLVGLRPTLPLVSRFGMMPATPSRDTLGPLARTVRDTALLLDVIAGYDPNDPITAASTGHIPPSYTSFLVPDGLKGKRIGVIRQAMAADTNPGAADYRSVRALIERAFVDLAKQGAEIVDEIEIPDLTDLMARSGGTFESEAATADYFAAHPNAPIKTLQEIILSTEVLAFRRARLMEGVGRTVDDIGHLHQMQAREQLRRNVLVAMADHRLDALAYATFDHDPVPIPADVMTRTAQVSQPGYNRQLAPAIAFPAITVPAGFCADGLPVGLELMGRPFAEGLLFTLALGYEQATSHRQPPTTTPALLGE